MAHRGIDMNIPISYQHLLPQRLILSRSQRLQSQRLGLEMIPTWWPVLSSIKKSSWAFILKNHTMGWYYSGLPKMGQLHFIHDRQHHFRKLVKGNKFQWAWRGPNRSKCQNWSGHKTCNKPSKGWSQGLQPMVPGRQKLSCRWTLSEQQQKWKWTNPYYMNFVSQRGTGTHWNSSTSQKKKSFVLHHFCRDQQRKSSYNSTICRPS